MLKILNDQVEAYLRELLPERDPLLRSLEQKAEQEFVSIVVPEVAQFLFQLALQKEAKNMLEVGTAIGYSTIWLARVARLTGGKVTTIEINQARYEKAQQSIKESGLEELITIIKSHAADVLGTLNEQYDFIFIDAAKGQYSLFLEELYPKLKAGGLIIFDNVLADGLVLLEDKEIERRQRTMVRRLREFLKLVSGHSGLVTSIIPMGDGLVVSYKKPASN